MEQKKKKETLFTVLVVWLDNITVSQRNKAINIELPLYLYDLRSRDSKPR